MRTGMDRPCDIPMRYLPASSPTAANSRASAVAERVSRFAHQPDQRETDKPSRDLRGIFERAGRPKDPAPISAAAYGPHRKTTGNESYPIKTHISSIFRRAIRGNPA